MWALVMGGKPCGTIPAARLGEYGDVPDGLPLPPSIPVLFDTRKLAEKLRDKTDRRFGVAEARLDDPAANLLVVKWSDSDIVEMVLRYRNDQGQEQSMPLLFSNPPWSPN